MKKFTIVVALCALASIGLAGCGNDTPEVVEYTVSFKNYDGSLLSESVVEKGNTAIYHGATPTRGETPEYTYTFKGWDQTLENITSNCVRVAQFNETYKPIATYYTVFFVNYDGSSLFEASVKAGETAIYGGTTPTREETAEYSYTFSGWDKSLNNITSDCVRVAQYTSTAKPVTQYFTVTFEDYDGTVLTTDVVEEGKTATYTGPTLSRPETTEYTYTFAGWDKSLENITSDCVRVAQYEKTAKPMTTYYTVTFKNYDGSILHEALVEEGGSATYGGDTPTRPSTSEFTYVFKGWDKGLDNITSNCIRTAQYDESYVDYTVKFYSYDNQLLYTDTVHYKESASYYGVTPTKPSTATHHYAFKGWDKDLSSITKSIEVRPLFDEIGDEKHIALNPNNEQNSYEVEITYGENYDLGTPSFPGFTFLGWYSNDTLIPTTGVWEYSEINTLIAKWENVAFIFADNGDNTLTAALSDVGKTMKEIYIPSRYQGLAVTALDADFAKQNAVIEKVSIPGTIENIPNYAFYNCSKLSSLVLNEGLVTIGDYAFNFCALTKLIIPSTCTTIGKMAFDSNSKLYHVYIPESVTTIGAYAFDVLNSLAYICTEHISIPSGWNSNWSTYTTYTSSTKLVEGEDFNYVIRSNYGDLSVTILRVSDAISKLQNYTFPNEIEGITDIRVGRYLFSNNQYIRSVDLTGITRIGTNAFYSCKNLASITLSNSLTFIDYNAFRYCSALTRLEIPESVTEIGNLAFDSCTSLEYIYIPSTVTTIGQYAFDVCGSAIIYTNAHTANSGWNSTWNRNQATYYDYVSNSEIGDFNYVVQSYMGDQRVTITGLKDSAKLKKSIVIPNEIEGISDIRLKSSLFSGFKELLSVNLGTGVKSVPASCFENCLKLENVVLHDGVTSIGQKAFYYCENLPSIDLPSTLTSIGKQAFDYCRGLREVNIPISVTTIGEYAFDVTGKTALLIESSVKQSGWASNWAGSTTTQKQFVYDYVSKGVIGELRYAKASNGVTDTIYILGLTDGSLATSIVIPDEIEGISNIKIANVAFDGNTILKTIDLGNSVTYVGDYAFRSNSSLVSVIIPLSCAVIKNYAFQNCNSSCVLNCEIGSKPDTWESNWNTSNYQVVWGYTR